MNTVLITLLVLFTAMVFSMPVEPEVTAEVTTVKDEVTTTLVPPDTNEIDYDESDEPIRPDDDDMEAAEVLVFRPMFSYRGVQASRRRKARRYYRNGYYYW